MSEEIERAELIETVRNIARRISPGDGAYLLEAADMLEADKAGGAAALTKAQERMLHDFPLLQQFYTKHALGPMLPPSCLCCGGQTHPVTRPVSVKHMELPGVVICKACKDAALLAADKAGGEPVAWRFVTRQGFASSWHEFLPSEDKDRRQEVVEVGGLIEYAYASQPAQQPLTEEYIDQHIGPDEGDREAVTAIVREVEAAHGIGKDHQ